MGAVGSVLPGDQEGRHQGRAPGGHVGGEIGGDGETVLDRVNPGGYGHLCAAERQRVRGHLDALPVRLIDKRLDFLIGPHQRAVWVALRGLRAPRSAR